MCFPELANWEAYGKHGGLTCCACFNEAISLRTQCVAVSTLDRGSMINGYFIFVLVAVLGFFLLDVVSRMMNLLMEVYEIDGPKRSTKANAFFTGLGNQKKIARYDRLIKNNGVGEFAHEIDHVKKKHIYNRWCFAS